MLSAGLLIGSGGGAIATADSDSGASTGQSQGDAGSSQGAGSATATDHNGADGAQETGQEVTTTAGSAEDKEPAEPQSSTTDPDTTNTEDDEGESTTAASESNGEAQSNPGGAGTNVASPDSNESGSGAATQHTNAVAPVTDPVTPFTNPPPPPPGASAPVTPISTTVGSITNMAVTIGNAAASIPHTLVSLPSSQTPVTDVITAVQNILISVVGAVGPVAQLPSDLYSLFGIAAAGPKVVGVGGGAALLAGIDGFPPLAPQASQSPEFLSAGIWGVPLSGDLAASPSLGTVAAVGLSHELLLSATTPLSPEGDGPAAARSLLEQVGAFLAPASLAALAALALPGIGGLLVICAAGIRVGYRQAKAGAALRQAGIGRFAGSGPLGVVRSGSLVSLRPRVRAVSPGVSRAAGLLDQVA